MITLLTRRLGFVALLIGTLGLADASAHTVNASALRVRSGPGFNFGIRTLLLRGTVVNTVKQQGDWTYIDRPRLGWVYTRYLSNTSHRPGVFPSGGRSFVARGTGYYPSYRRVEGGFRDRFGRRLHTLQAYLAGTAPYVSVAMDPRAFRYGTRLRIREIEQRYHRVILFRVVDSGGDFYRRGTSRIDICVANYRASVSLTINRRLHCVVVR